MRSIFDDFDTMECEDEGEKVFLFQDEFPGYEKEPVRGTILRKEERYSTLNLIGADLSPIVTKKRGKRTDFSVVPSRPHFMLASEEYLMKAHKNQWLWRMPSPPALLWEP